MEKASHGVAFDGQFTRHAINRTMAAMLTGLTIVGALIVAVVSPDAVPVVAPLAAIAFLTASSILRLFQDDGQLPVFDLGALTILITAFYSSIPLIGFWLAGLQWTELSYLPLYQLNPSASEVGGFAWRHVLYLCSFTAAYLIFRGRIPIRCGPIRELRPTAIVAIAIVGAGLLMYFKLLELMFGVSYDPSYNDLAATAASIASLPHLVRQFSHNLFAILFLVKVAALLWLVSRWNDRRSRFVLFIWLAVEGFSTVTRMGGRTWYVMLLMASVLLYHRIVKPLSIARAAILIVALLGGALGYGLARDIGGGLHTVMQTGSSRWAAMNEFQALYGIAYDLHARQLAGTLGPIPWQIYLNDIVMLIPSQLLPFAKADPCTGYTQSGGAEVGCVLGVISNAVVGLDWAELIARGLGLGLLFAVVHRWYAWRQDSFWATLLYLCMCLWSYYTYRGSTFFFGYYILYRFVPLIVAVGLIQFVLQTLPRLVELPRAETQ
jgi:hypothetical protein